MEIIYNLMKQDVKPYSETGSKKKQVTNMFDNVAPFYDFLNRLLSLRMDVLWRRTMIKMLKKENPKKILDMATGTADVALETAKQIAPEKIVGVDISPQMLAIGQKKIEKRGQVDVIKLQLGDSENLAFKDNTFDAATVAFGVRNFENLEKGLEELKRVVKVDGKLFVLEFSKPTIFPFKQLFNFYFKYILPLIGRLTSKDPKAYQYLYESVQAFPDGEDFLKVMKKLGFKETIRKPLTLGICTIYVGRK